ncbi:50S ribosomal protein L25/general stress protein Ctc [Modestobacter sp. SYSU DS0511]
MADFRLVAEPRTEFGKGSARRTRRAGRVPAVMYGHGQDVVHLSVPALEFAAVLRNGGTNALITVTLDGKDQLVLIKAVQRDPLTRVHEHVDLVVVRRGEKVTVDVPVLITGQAAPDAISNHQLNAVSLEADATNLPESIEVDITGRGAGENITAADLTLPAGATLITDPEALVIGFLGAPSAAELEADLGTEATDAPEGDIVPEPLDQGSGESMDSAEKSSDD